MGTGKKKIEIKRKEKEEQTISKRRQGLFQKAHQLHSLTGTNIAVLAFSLVGRLYIHGEPSFDAIINCYLNPAVQENEEEHCEAANHWLSLWLNALQFEACDSVEELQLLKNEFEEREGKVIEKIGHSFTKSLLV